MKKEQKRWIWIALVILVAIMVFVWIMAKSKATTGYQEYTIKKGDIIRYTNLAGQMQAEGSTAITGPSGRIIDTIVVKENEAVSAGQVIATLNTEEIEERIKETNARIKAAEMLLISLDEEKTTKEIKACVSGRVKEINKSNYSENNLILLSLDGRMRVVFESDESIDIKNAKITVECGGEKYNGVLYRSKGSTYIVTASDAELMQGKNATVKADGKTVGSGTVEINVPFWVTGELSNIESYAVAVNESVKKEDRMATLKVAIPTEAYESAIKERNEAEAELSWLMALKEDPNIYAPESGVIKELRISVYAPITGETKETVIGIIIPSIPNIFTATVPERYINDIAIGMETEITLSAFSEECKHGTVKEISPIGDYKSGITTYEVKFEILENGKERIGMSGTVKIETGQEQNCLRLPIELLHMNEVGYYVLVYDAEGNTIEREVEIGLSNEDYVEIKEGLAEGETVLYQGTLTVAEE